MRQERGDERRKYEDWMGRDDEKDGGQASDASAGDCGISVFFFQAEDGIRDLVRSHGLGDVYERQIDQRLFSRQFFLLPFPQ